MDSATEVVCPFCSHKGVVRSVIAIGTKIRCQKCRATFDYEPPTLVRTEAPVNLPIVVDVSPSPGLAHTETDQPTAWYHDRVWVVGLSIPAAIVLAFGVYLWFQFRHSSQIRILNAHAASLAEAGMPTDAMRTYREMILLVGDDKSPESIRLVTAARQALVKLDVKAKEQERARKAAESEAAEQAKRDEIAKAQEAIDESRARERERLASIRGTIEGTAFVNRVDGSATVLPGMEVLLLSKTLKKPDIDVWLNAFASETRKYKRAHPGAILVDKLKDASLSPIQELDLKFFLIASRPPEIGGFRILDDASWPVAAALAIEKRTSTNIEGKYIFKDVRGGEHYVHAFHATDLGGGRANFIDWLRSVSVADEETITLDLNNLESRVIIND